MPEPVVPDVPDDEDEEDDPTPPATLPTAPANLQATAVSSSQINLAWTASTDDVGVTGYRIYRNSVQIDTTAGTTYSSTGLSASTTYAYTVRAYDGAGNIGGLSNTATETTTSSSVTTCPEGEITETCTCVGVDRSSGYCCTGIWDQDACRVFYEDCEDTEFHEWFLERSVASTEEN